MHSYLLKFYRQVNSSLRAWPEGHFGPTSWWPQAAQAKLVQTGTSVSRVWSTAEALQRGSQVMQKSTSWWVLGSLHLSCACDRSTSAECQYGLSWSGTKAVGFFLCLLVVHMCTSVLMCIHCFHLGKKPGLCCPSIAALQCFLDTYVRIWSALGVSTLLRSG